MASYNTGVTASATNITSATNFTFTVPAGVLTGDVMIVSLNVFSFTANTFGMSTPSSGGGSWTQIGTTQAGSQGSIGGWGSAWYRVATASDPGSTFTVHWTGTNSGGNQFWWASDLEAYTGFYTASPIGNFQATVVNATSVTCPSVVTARSGSWGIYTCPSSINTSGSITGEPATNRHVINPGAGVDNAISDSNGSAGAAGSTIGGGSFTFQNSSGGDGIAFTIELCTVAPNTPVEAPSPPQVPHPLWPDLLEVAAQRADWQAQGAATPVQAHWRLMDGLNGRPGIGSSGTQPPASATSNAGGQVNGTSFYVTQGGQWLEGYWYYCCASGQSTAPVKCALWTCINNAGSVVPGSVVTSGTLTAGAWNWVPLPQPVQLAIYGQYVAAAGIPASAGYPDTSGQFGPGNPYSSGITNGPLSGFSDLGASNAPPYSAGQGCTSNAGSDPSQVLPLGNSGTHDNFWVDVQVTNQAPAGYNGSYRLWPNMRDSSSATVTDSAVNYVIGTEIILSQPCAVNAIWYYVAPGQGSSNNQWATSADIWRVRDGVRVATQANPVWINPYAGGVDGQSNSGRWVYCTLPGQVYLPAGDYYVTVYNGNGSPNGWGVTQFHYWQSGNTPGNTYQTAAAGINGITTGPMTAPTTPAASVITDYNTPSVQEPGQSVFAVGPPNQFPNRYVGTPTGGAFQNYWVDLEVTPAATFQPDQPLLPQRTPHPLLTQLLEVAAYRAEGQPPPVTDADTGTGTEGATVQVADSDTGSGADQGSVTVLGSPPSAVLIPPGRQSPMAFQRHAWPAPAPLLVPDQDAGTGAEGSTVSPQGSDTGTGTDSAAITVSDTDSGAGAESSLEGPAVQAFPLTPPGRMSPMAWRFQARPSQAPPLVPSGDSGTGAEGGGQVSPQDSDTGSAAEAATVQVSDADAGSAAEASLEGPPVQAYPLIPPGFTSPMAFQRRIWPTQAPLGVPSGDSGSGADSGFQDVEDTDSGTAAETAQITVADSDSGSGADAGQVLTSAAPGTVLIPPGFASPMAFRHRTWPTRAASAGAVQVSDTDTGTGADTALVEVSDADSGAGADSAAISISSAETGSGADTGAVQVASPDTGTAADSAGITIPAAETGSGADSAAISVTSPDTGTGADASALDVQGADTGAGADAASASATVPGSDTGSGADSGTVPGTIPPGLGGTAVSGSTYGGTAVPGNTYGGSAQ